MAQLTISVNDRNYVVKCEDGQENHIQSLAGYLDRQTRQMANSLGQVGDTRLLLLTALVITDDLSKTMDEVNTLKKWASESDHRAHSLAERVEKVLADLSPS